MKKLFFAALLLLAGCWSPPQDVCSGYGYRSGTDAAAQCAERVVSARRQWGRDLGKIYERKPAPASASQYCYWAGSIWTCNSL
jgi:hypothetical protein